VTTKGRLSEPREFEEIILRANPDGSALRLRDVARVELAADRYVTSSLFGSRQAVGLALFQRPGSNAIEASRAINARMAELARDFPPGMRYQVLYNPTEYISQSIDAVYVALLESTLLVVAVILLFLQNWRAAVIPILAIPVSLVGTFAVMALTGVTLNNLSLFGLVLAIGIVVDDAIVVVENIERNLARGLAPRAASVVTMDEVGTALVSIGLVLTAVFVPTAFLGGIAGEMFRQFGLTVATATAISVVNSLTLSPALGAVLLRSHDAPPGAFDRWWDRTLGVAFSAFNRGYDAFAQRYVGLVGHLVRRPALPVAAFGVMLALTGVGLWFMPTGFIPALDQGYVIVLAELPKGASLERTSEVVKEIARRANTVDGTVPRSFGFAGFSIATGASSTQSATVFVGLQDFPDRGPGRTAERITADLGAALRGIQDAAIVVVMPPPIRGIGNGSDFKMLIRDRAGHGARALEAATWAVAGAGTASGAVARAFTTFSTAAPRVQVDIDRTRAQMLEVPLANVFETLRVFLGSEYINDFNLFGRNYRVTAQADAPFRLTTGDVARLRAANVRGEMVPLGSIVSVHPTAGPDRVVRHNLYPAAELLFTAAPGRSSGEALDAMARVAGEALPAGFDFEWTELAYQQRSVGGLGLLVFPLGILFVFLVLTAQYESWSLPFVIVLLVPLVMLFALVGLNLRGMDLNILAQIGFVVLIGLASKNAILLVEFARQREEQGADPIAAAVDAARLRLRPILMTSLAFIAGVVPLGLAIGAGAEMRRVLGTVVLSGMLGVTLVGLLLTPVFYVLVRRRIRRA
ncbi:MAG: efflux RND transporter permease subunit, partial [Gammaproteobacteria bacterium]|nr:efflux RND transporter permease subunit [Gammaproteobacteria bacterium]